ncbi:hypothetical protein niasHS_005563 [Heterodera schachtii]|uniref:Uncharacterized protein n=1 Tax=Heterodera schachtii TaxID=97005 RepID=A0ABD2JYT2_HETSC
MALLNCFTNLSNFFLPAVFLLGTVILSSNGGAFVEGIFYRNIPFRYKATESGEETKGTFGTNEDKNVPREWANNKNPKNGIRALLNQIEAEESRLLPSSAADDTPRRPPLPPRRTSRLIALLPLSADGMVPNVATNTEPMMREIEQHQQNGAANSVSGKAEAYDSDGYSNAEVPSPAAAAPLHALAPLRPDYALKNVADFFRNLFDSRIERSRKNTADEGGRRLGFDDNDWWARSLSI